MADIQRQSSPERGARPAPGHSLRLCLAFILLVLAVAPVPALARQAPAGPIVGELLAPARFDGDLRDLPQIDAARSRAAGSPDREIPLRSLPAGLRPAAGAAWLDPLALARMGRGQMPPLLVDFAGLDYEEWGAGVPPDTNGDVGPNHYIQAVNTSLGIYDKASGARLAAFTYDDFFQGTGTPCDYRNRGDVVVLYDPLADRWLVSDFAFLRSGGPYYECLAVSQSGDPVNGGWHFYALPADPDSLPDYPKLGVWPDAYYLSANMFGPLGWEGARVYALDRQAMLDGQPLAYVSFDLGPAYGGLLPANLRGALPPDGSPGYFAAIGYPDTLNLWRFHVDWQAPANSTLTGPIALDVAPFGLIFDIPQPGLGWDLDSLGDRLMMQLQYRNLGSHDALWANHTVSSGGTAGVRWYEVRDPGGAPVLYQQGTYQPDGHYRWMASLAVDRDGNMALGYSVSGEDLYPGIRYAGRLAGELPGALPQGEASMIEGSGVQVGSRRWGDYSAMTVDPVDDCTFWYTQEYYVADGIDWQTRIGAFRFPSCGQPKGWIAGTVYDAGSGAPLPGVPLVADGPAVNLTVQTGASGRYTATLPASTYDLLAGPLLPGYPQPASVSGVAVAAGLTTTVDIALAPQPDLAGGAIAIDDGGAGGNGNGHPEPGESGLLLWRTVANTGAATATQVTARLLPLSPGVTVTVDGAAYPDLPAGGASANLAPFELSIAPEVTCGALFDFQQVVTTGQGIFHLPFSLQASIPLSATALFSDDMEAGTGGWTTGGSGNAWAITQEAAHSPSHAWSDSPGGDYPDEADAWLQSPPFDLGGRAGVALSFWHRYALETAADVGYLETSLDGGVIWQPLAQYTGFQPAWIRESFELPAFDGQASAAFRFRLVSDRGLTEDGWYLDDVALSYRPVRCRYGLHFLHLPLVLREG